MKKYRIQKHIISASLFPAFVQYHVQLKVFWFWITIKTFVDDDPDFALQLAEELIEKLEEE